MLILFSLIGNFVKFPIREKPSGQDAHACEEKMSLRDRTRRGTKDALAKVIVRGSA